MLKKLLLIICLLAPTATFAAPEAISGVEVTYENGTTTVSWDKSDATDIKQYNVYYSMKSILDNGGEWDDYDATTGPTSFYEFKNLEGGKKYYFSVLAVDKNNAESAGFISEASITIPEKLTGTTQSSTAASEAIFNLPIKQTVTASSTAPLGPNSNPSLLPQKAESVELLSVDVVSPTELKVNFSVPITVTEEGAVDAFKITDPDGNELRLTQLTIDGEDVRVHTEPQVKNRVYQLKVSEPIQGYINYEPLDADARTMLFTGHSEGGDSSGNTGTVTLDSLEYPGDVLNMRMNYTPSTVPGQYDVVVEWDRPNVTGGLAYYMVSQTHDGGKTYLNPELLETNIGGVFLPGITAPFFGVKVNTVNAAGYVSKGVLKTIQIGLTPISSSSSSSSSVKSVPSAKGTTPPVGSVTPAPVTGKTGPVLPNSGTIISTLIPALIGVSVSLYYVRRRRVQTV